MKCYLSPESSTCHSLFRRSPTRTHRHHISTFKMSESLGDTMESDYYPERPGEPDCSFYIRTGQCSFGAACRYNHPPNRKVAIVNARIRGEYPERVGQPECLYYLKTGTCKFGATCKFHHPRDKAAPAGTVSFNSLGYPLRPNETECSYYLRTGQCKFGSTCKFHHPQPSNMISVHNPHVYASVNSPTSPGNQSYPGVTNWSRASLISSPRWEGPSSYTPLIMPQGVVSVPGWNTYRGQLSAISSPDSQKQPAENSQIRGSSFHGELPNEGSQGAISPYQVGSVPLGFYSLQGDYMFPERPSQPECQYYLKTGDCKFGANCKFHHPKLRLIPAPNCLLSPMGLPSRPGEPLCIYYTRFGICKFGPSCKFDHPMEISAYDSAVLSSTDATAGRLSSSSRDAAAPTLTLKELGEDEEESQKSEELPLSDSRQIHSDNDNDEREE